MILPMLSLNMDRQGRLNKHDRDLDKEMSKTHLDGLREWYIPF